MRIVERDWGAVAPRRWQAECLPRILRHFQQEQPQRAIVRAIMGSGKSVLIAQLLACCDLEPGEVIVVSTPTIKLVKQLADTLRARLDTPDILGTRVGTYYTYGKDIDTPVIVTCIPSLLDLVHALRAAGRKCAMWIPDECHKVQTDHIVLEAFPLLNPARVCGFTATPFRAEENERLTLFDKMLYDYGPKEALEDDPSPVVPWRIIPWMGGESTLDAACIQMTTLANGPGMFNAMTIDDAKQFSMQVNEAGMKCEAIHSKLSQQQIDKRIYDLHGGRLQALVHVAMLSEGVDLPWLRWLCMRRPVASRVRFVQEVGRVLRRVEDKAEAMLYDPHDLFGSFNLSYEAVLGGDYLVDEDEDDAELARKELDTMLFDMFRAMTVAAAEKQPLPLTPLAAYLRQLVVAFDMCGLIEGNRKIASRSWRANPCSDKQKSAVPKMGWALGRKCVPSQHKRALELLSTHAPTLNRGMASDLLSVLFSLADKKKWPNFKPIDAAVEEGLKKHDEKRQVLSTPKAVPKQGAVKRRPEPTLFTEGEA